jgi:hypothetical protein
VKVERGAGVAIQPTEPSRVGWLDTQDPVLFEEVSKPRDLSAWAFMKECSMSVPATSAASVWGLGTEALPRAVQ